MKFVVFIVLLIMCHTVCQAASVLEDKLAANSKTKSCTFDSNCPPNSTCDHEFPNPIGTCKVLLPSGSYCLRDKSCASQNCHFWKCV